jgi:hypothetical protein
MTMLETALFPVVWGIVPSGHVIQVQIIMRFMGKVGNFRAERQKQRASLVFTNGTGSSRLHQTISLG